MDKIPIVVGNELPNVNAQLKNLTLREYLQNFHTYMSASPFVDFLDYSEPGAGDSFNLLSKDMKAQVKFCFFCFVLFCFVLYCNLKKQNKF